MKEYNKKESCKNCPDRTVEPNCHMDCKEYLERAENTKARNQKVTEAKMQEGVTKAYFKSLTESIRKRKGKNENR